MPPPLHEAHSLFRALEKCLAGVTGVWLHCTLHGGAAGFRLWCVVWSFLCVVVPRLSATTAWLAFIAVVWSST